MVIAKMELLYDGEKVVGQVWYFNNKMPAAAQEIVMRHYEIKHNCSDRWFSEQNNKFLKSLPFWELSKKKYSKIMKAATKVV